jgi:hypothetical protein
MFIKILKDGRCKWIKYFSQTIIEGIINYDELISLTKLKEK